MTTRAMCQSVGCNVDALYRVRVIENGVGYNFVTDTVVCDAHVGATVVTSVFDDGDKHAFVVVLPL